jgi:peptidoglycan/xylan/chitin deacetylase (PgdA/CDA1 family)
MSLEQMHLLTKSPYVTLGSHGMRHRNMTKLPDDENRYEIHESYRILSAEFGEAFLPVFAYPWGACNSRVVDLMGESPYQYAFTVETAPWHSHAHRFQVPRYSAYYRDGNPAVFLAKLLRHKLLFA